MDFTEKFSKKISRYEGRIISVQVDEITMPDGGKALREVLDHPGGVTILPVDDDGFAYCVRQYRYAFSEVMLEAPAGKLEYGEQPETCAIRELSEETGISAREIIPLGSIYPSPGYSKEILYIYLALGLSFGDSHPDEDELLRVEKIHLNELTRMVHDGQINDAKTIVAILKSYEYLRNK